MKAGIVICGILLCLLSPLLAVDIAMMHRSTSDTVWNNYTEYMDIAIGNTNRINSFQIPITVYSPNGSVTFDFQPQYGENTWGASGFVTHFPESRIALPNGVYENLLLSGGLRVSERPPNQLVLTGTALDDVTGIGPGPLERMMRLHFVPHMTTGYPRTICFDITQIISLGVDLVFSDFTGSLDIDFLGGDGEGTWCYTVAELACMVPSIITQGSIIVGSGSDGLDEAIYLEASNTGSNSTWYADVIEGSGSATIDGFGTSATLSYAPGPDEIKGTARIKVVATDAACGTYSYHHINAEREYPVYIYMCGDSNGDDDVNLGDAVAIINYIFKGGDAPDPLYMADVNRDDIINAGDAIGIINYIFKDGPAPCSF